MLIHAFYSAVRSQRASSWPKANGEVIYADIQEEDDHDSTSFYPVIEYRYKVGSREYRSKRVTFGTYETGFRFSALSIQKK